MIGSISVQKHKLALRTIVISAPILVFLMCMFFKQNIVIIASHFPKCRFYGLLHLYCPACGNTRSVLSLLNFDIVSAVKYNITPVVLGLIILAFYIEIIAYTFGKNVKVVPRSNVFLFAVIFLMLIYYVVRNFFI